jgi:glycine betaine/choline ABC-type transport system substrate-binding protein
MKATISSILVASVLGSACGNRSQIVVGSKNFTEQIILGEIAAQQIERKLKIPVQRKLDLGGTLLTQEAILNGQIDVYPEYTGTAASVVLKQKSPPTPGEAYVMVKQAYLERFHLVWLPPLGFNDTFAMVVRRREAKKLRAATLSGAAARAWRLGIGYEFLTRPDGLQRLDSVYHLRWEGTPKSMDLGLLYAALGEEKVDMAAGNSTDAQLANTAFTVLADDKKAFPPYNACYVIRQGTSQRYPQVTLALSMLQNSISDDTMRDLNRKVDVLHQPPEQVAREFLASQP